MATRRARAAVTSGRRSGGTEERRPNRMIHRGEEALRRTDSELEKQKQRREQGGKGEPFRFFVGVGETKEIVVLDEEPVCFLYEHTVQDPRTRKYTLRLPCIAEYDNCPVCEAHGDSTASYVMFLSVLDLTPFKTKRGETVEFSRKLLPVKLSNQKKFIRRLKKDGTLRGAIFECSRDGDKDPAIGNDIEFIEFMDMEELENDYINTWKDKDGKEHTENLSEPFDYEAIFKEPTADELRRRIGGEAPQNSNRQARRDIGMDDHDDDDGDGWDNEAASPPWDGEEEEQEKPTRRSSRASRRTESEAPASTRRSSRRTPPADEVDEEEEEEERPARRSRAAVSRRRR